MLKAFLRMEIAIRVACEAFIIMSTAADTNPRLAKRMQLLRIG